MLRNIRACLNAVGASMQNVISRTTCVLDMNNAHNILAIFLQYFDAGTRRPASRYRSAPSFPAMP